MTPVAYGVLDLAALRHNLTRVREYSGGVRVLAVIKANAYGHGLITVAKALEAVEKKKKKSKPNNKTKNNPDKQVVKEQKNQH